MMRPIVFALLAAVLAAQPASAEPPEKKPPEAKKDKPVDPAAAFKQQLDTIVNEYNKARQEFIAAISAAPSDEERKKALAGYPKPDSFAARVLELAGKEPAQPAALEGLAWVLGQPGGGELSKHQSAAADAIFKHFRDNEALAGVCQQLGNGLGNPATETLLRQLVDKSQNQQVKGNACFVLANLLKRAADVVPQIQSLEGIQKAYVEAQFGKDFLDKMAKRDATRLYAEAETLYERVVKEFAKIESGRGTLGEAADSELYELRFLAVGKPAPAIEGEDIDGAKFSLADYRGKVVVLDFWGNW